eukprot:gene2850-8745_t
MALAADAPLLPPPGGSDSEAGLSMKTASSVDLDEEADVEAIVEQAFDDEPARRRVLPTRAAATCSVMLPLTLVGFDATSLPIIHAGLMGESS